MCIDTWIGTAEEQREQYTGTDVLPEFKRNLGALLPHVEPWQMTSLEAATHFHEPVSLLFIDACHRYDDVRADVLAWVPKLSLGGLLLLHDTWDATHDWPIIFGARGPTTVAFGLPERCFHKVGREVTLAAYQLKAFPEPGEMHLTVKLNFDPSTEALPGAFAPRDPQPSAHEPVLGLYLPSRLADETVTEIRDAVTYGALCWCERRLLLQEWYRVLIPGGPVILDDIPDSSGTPEIFARADASVEGVQATLPSAAGNTAAHIPADGLPTTDDGPVLALGRCPVESPQRTRQSAETLRYELASAGFLDVEVSQSASGPGAILRGVARKPAAR